MVEIWLGVIIALLLLLIALVMYALWRQRPVKPEQIQTAVAQSWLDLKLDHHIGAIENRAQEIQSSYRTLEEMLRVPATRGSLGEITLETMLADQLPESMYGIRERAVDGRIPDAWIQSTVGLICVDSKFPLDNYVRMVEATAEESHTTHKRAFLRNVRGHLRKISQDYVRPDQGTAEFAFAYIPSEAVYYFLVTEAFELLDRFTARGVQVVSPLTLSQKIALIRAGVGAERLSQEAQEVKDRLVDLATRFEAVDEAWRILYDTHLHHLAQKADELDQAYTRLRDGFHRVADAYR